LKPGGTIYIQENSILLMEFYPDCPHFKKVWMPLQIISQGLRRCHDRIRLYEMLKRAGFVHPELSLAPKSIIMKKGPWYLD